MEREDVKSILESLLFVADGPLTVQRLTEVIDGTSKDEVRSILEDLKHELQNTRRGIRLVVTSESFKDRKNHPTVSLTHNRCRIQ